MHYTRWNFKLGCLFRCFRVFTVWFWNTKLVYFEASNSVCILTEQVCDVTIQRFNIFNHILCWWHSEGSQHLLFRCVTTGYAESVRQASISTSETSLFGNKSGMFYTDSKIVAHEQKALEILHFFLRLSSMYRCSICSCTNSRQPHTRTPHSHYAYTNKPTTILRSLDHVLCEITGSNHGPIGDGARRIPFVALRMRGNIILFGGEPRWETRVRFLGIELAPAASPPAVLAIRALLGSLAVPCF